MEFGKLLESATSIIRSQTELQEKESYFMAYCVLLCAHVPVHSLGCDLLLSRYICI